MKSHFVGDLQPNETVTTFFLVHSKELRSKKGSGDPYLALTLADKTGQIEAKMWDGVEAVADTFERDDFVKVKGSVQLYRDRPQLIVHLIRPALDEEIEVADFLPHTKYDIEQMFEQLLGNVRAFQNADLRKLVLAFLEDEEVAARLKRAPAAKSLHHARIGGLLEHITSLMGLAQRVAENYEFLDRDLLLTGVVLHDLGKVEELQYERSFGYSDEGQLLGHITIMLRLMERKCNEIKDFPHKWRLLVEHMILSHHGRYEFGSPKLPMFPEALALAYIDDLDSKLESMRAQTAAGDDAGGNWSRYNASLERSLLKKEDFLLQPGESPHRPAPPLPGSPSAAPEATSPDGRDSSSAGRSSQRQQRQGLFAEKLQSALKDKT